MDFEELDAQFDRTEEVLVETEHPLKTIQEMEKLMRMFFHYLEDKLDEV